VTSSEMGHDYSKRFLTRIPWLCFFFLLWSFIFHICTFLIFIDVVISQVQPIKIKNGIWIWVIIIYLSHKFGIHLSDLCIQTTHQNYTHNVYANTGFVYQKNLFYFHNNTLKTSCTLWTNTETTIKDIHTSFCINTQ